MAVCPFALCQGGQRLLIHAWDRRPEGLSCVSPLQSHCLSGLRVFSSHILAHTQTGVFLPCMGPVRTQVGRGQAARLKPSKEGALAS